MIDRLKGLDGNKRQDLIDDLSRGITNTSEFGDALNYIIDNKLDMFSDDYFRTPIEEGEDDIIMNLILPTFRRVWAQVYVNLPDILNKHVDVITSKYEDRIKLYQAFFNIDEFLDYFKRMMLETKDCLSDFKYLDKTVEHVTLIANNYIAYLLKITSESENVKMDIRNSKLRKILK